MTWLSHAQVAANDGRVALERGPIVYCAEGVDNEGSVGDLVLADDVLLQAEHRNDLLNGVTVISGQLSGAEKRPFVAIPYYAWAH